MRHAGLLGLIALAAAVGAWHVAAILGGPSFGAELRVAIEAALRHLDGAPVYVPAQLDGPFPPDAAAFFLHPPPTLALVMPMALLLGEPSTISAWIWAALGAAGVAWACLAFVQAGLLDGRFTASRRRTGAVIVAAVLLWAPVASALAVGSTQPAVFGLLALAWLRMRRHGDRDQLVAGLAIAAAALIGVLSGLLVLWLLLRPHLREAAWALVAVPLLGVLTLPITGIGAWFDYVVVLFNMGAAEATPDAVSPTLWMAPLLGYETARLAVAIAGIATMVVVARRVRDDAVSFALAVTLVVLLAPAAHLAERSLLGLALLLALVAGAPLSVVALAYGLVGVAPALVGIDPTLARVAATAGAAALVGALLRAGRSPEAAMRVAPGMAT